MTLVVFTELTINFPVKAAGLGKVAYKLSPPRDPVELWDE